MSQKHCVLLFCLTVCVLFIPISVFVSNNQQENDLASVIIQLQKQRNQLSHLLNQAHRQLQQLQCDLGANISSAGGWCDWAVAHKHYTDIKLVVGLAELLAGKTVASFGEGPGEYRRQILQLGTVTGYDAYDGAPHIENTTGHAVKYLDLATPQYGLPTYDWVISIEVAEHISRPYESIYLDNLVRHAREGIVLSWAPSHQLGFSHTNGRSSSYVDDRLRALCFSKDDAITNKLRRSTHYPWLRQNIKGFIRNARECPYVELFA